jgi:hypothetical protein
VSPAGDDLDIVIGDLRREAARRRAEPDFPIEDEARLGVELDRQSPRPPAPKLDRLADAAQAAADSANAGWTGPGGPTGRAAQRAASAVLGPLPGQVSSVASILATALRTVSARIQDLDARLQRLELAASRTADQHPPAAGSGPKAGSAGSEQEQEPDGGAATVISAASVGPAIPIGADSALAPGDAVPAGQPAAWLPDASLPLDGRLLYAGSDAEAAVTSLRRQGLDAYGLTPAGDPYLDHPDVRPGNLVDHLETVGDQSLGAVLLEGTTEVVESARIADLVTELARVTGTVVIAAEAPWWWRERVGPERADTSLTRPLSPETWLAVLHRAGFEGALDYGPSARRYRVAARRR